MRQEPRWRSRARVPTDKGKKWYPFSVEEHNPPFDMASPVKEVMYSPLEKAEKKWNICVSFPHMKDAYWLAVDYGVVGGG